MMNRDSVCVGFRGWNMESFFSSEMGRLDIGFIGFFEEGYIQVSCSGEEIARFSYLVGE
uniref:Uncharacterized protein n=1 Tax=Nelumbo nucifera TaxID=4432 RepID=A0A822Y9R2_NELNU|nr:TPA_asm: hypothetical protein HUJ06_030520 [Nelumbo nucifera]